MKWLLEKQGRCEQSATVFYFLCAYFGFEVESVYGPRHRFCQVKLGKEWLLVNPTGHYETGNKQDSYTNNENPQQKQLEQQQTNLKLQHRRAKLPQPSNSQASIAKKLKKFNDNLQLQTKLKEFNTDFSTKNWSDIKVMWDELVVFRLVSNENKAAYWQFINLLFNKLISQCNSSSEYEVLLQQESVQVELYRKLLGSFKKPAYLFEFFNNQMKNIKLNDFVNFIMPDINAEKEICLSFKSILIPTVIRMAQQQSDFKFIENDNLLKLVQHSSHLEQAIWAEINESLDREWPKGLDILYRFYFRKECYLAQCLAKAPVNKFTFNYLLFSSGYQEVNPFLDQKCQELQALVADWVQKNIASLNKVKYDKLFFRDFRQFLELNPGIIPVQFTEENAFLFDVLAESDDLEILQRLQKVVREQNYSPLPESLIKLWIQTRDKNMVSSWLAKNLKEAGQNTVKSPQSVQLVGDELYTVKSGAKGREYGTTTQHRQFDLPRLLAKKQAFKYKFANKDERQLKTMVCCDPSQVVVYEQLFEQGMPLIVITKTGFTYVKDVKELRPLLMQYPYKGTMEAWQKLFPEDYLLGTSEVCKKIVADNNLKKPLGPKFRNTKKNYDDQNKFNDIFGLLNSQVPTDYKANDKLFNQDPFKDDDDHDEILEIESVK